MKGKKKWEVECKVVDKPAYYSPKIPATLFDPDGFYKLAYIEQKIAQFTAKLAVAEEQYNKEPSSQVKNATAYYKEVVWNYEAMKAKKLASLKAASSKVQMLDEQAPVSSLDFVEALAKQQNTSKEPLNAPYTIGGSANDK